MKFPQANIWDWLSSFNLMVEIATSKHLKKLIAGSSKWNTTLIIHAEGLCTDFKAKPAVNYPDNLCSCSLSYIQSVVVYLISIQQVNTVLNNNLPSPLKRAVSSLCSVEMRRKQSLFSAWRMGPGSLTPPKSIVQSFNHHLGRLHIVDYALSIVETLSGLCKLYYGILSVYVHIGRGG